MIHENEEWMFEDLEHLKRHTHRSDKLKSDNTLHVIGVISNPTRVQSRVRLFREWYKAMLGTPNVQVHIVEIAHGDRCHEITHADHPNHLQLRTKHELWHKENMINLAVKHLLPKDWKYVCWADCDIFFKDKKWALNTIHELQHYDVVQPWATVLDCGPDGEGMRLFESFCHVVHQNVPLQTHPSQPYKYAHSGFAWACTRKFWENVGGLMEKCIVGSADHHMAFALVNRVHHSVHGGMTEGFKRMANEWQANAFRVTQGNVGFVNTHIEHKFHGSKKRRYYRERWSIFIDHQYDPYKDVAYDEQGLIYILGKPKMCEEIRRYNRSRREDGTDKD